MGIKYFFKSKHMKFLALLAVVVAQDEEGGDAAAALESGASCADNKTGCGEGLCCGEGVAEDDVVDGKVSENYEENMVVVCNDATAEEFTGEEDAKYFFSAS